ncbi:hypothetical protein A0256_11875 [Mucilaginibacter sp. PAMC 26640]|nr:hypothetical protein A0256_11875 [Mucilaginibacter sp. PAMC 26640]
MRIKTIIILIFTIVLTIIFMQNLEAVKFTFLFATIYISKVTVMLIVSAIAFIIGFLAGRPPRSKFSHTSYDEEPSTDSTRNSKINTLSDDDRDYLN